VTRGDLAELGVVVAGMYVGFRLIFSPSETNLDQQTTPVPEPPRVESFAPPTVHPLPPQNNTEAGAVEAVGDRLSAIKDIADSIGYDWRSAGGVIHYGCPPGSRCYCSETSCHYGSVFGAEGRKRVDVWIFEHAFVSESRLRYVVLHEIAHVWQVQMRGWEGRYGDFERWLPRGVDPMEATADCLAKVWGASPPRYAYWDCPAPAEEYMRMLYEGSVS